MGNVGVKYIVFAYNRIWVNSHGGQRRAILESIISNACYAFTDSHGGQRRAITESIISNACYAIRDSDGGERGAIKESIISNARYAVRDGNRGQRRARTESIISNAYYTIRDSHGGQRRAITESIISNAGHAIRDSHRGQRRATIESILSNACYAVRDSHRGQRIATLESIISYFLDIITNDILSNLCAKYIGNVGGRWIFFAYNSIWIDSHIGQRRAITESRTSNARDAIRDSHRGQRRATSESIISNACYAVRDSHRGQRRAILESIRTNACHVVRNYQIFDFLVVYIEIVWTVHWISTTDTKLNVAPTCNIASIIGFGQRRAIFESRISNAGHAVRDSDRGEGGAISKSIISNARDAVGSPIVSNGFGNCYRTRIFAFITIIRTSSISNRSGLGTAVKIIPDTTNFRIRGVNYSHASC